MLIKCVFVSLLLLFYAFIATCLILIVQFEAAWDRGDDASFPEECSGITSDPAAIVGCIATGALIIVVLVA